MSRAQGIDERTLGILRDANGVRGLRIVGQGSRWYVEIQHGQGGQWSPVVAQRGHVRTWARLDTVIEWMQEQGFAEASIDARAYDPQQKALS